jgi:type II restriction enzyme
MTCSLDNRLHIMQLKLKLKLADQYKSLPQKTRVLTESWVRNEVYCPNCNSSYLSKYSNNKSVADFFCQRCKEDFELKSKGNKFGKKVVDGAYQSMLDRLQEINNPNFFMLNYDTNSHQVLNFFVIPKYFFVPNVIEKRRPLSYSARRSGWVGCNILLNKIPKSGRIFLIKNKLVESKEKVRALWKKTSFLRDEKKTELRGWILDIMTCIESIGKNEFTLKDMYKYEKILSKQHPANNHIRDKIRQQLQILRDRNYIHFIGKGKYQLI